MSPAVWVFLGVAVVFFMLAKLDARPGFNAFALGICLVFTPAIAGFLPGHGDWRDAMTFGALLIIATIGTALGGGLKPREGEEHDHHHHEHSH